MVDSDPTPLLIKPLPRRWVCIDCKEPPPFTFVVHDRLWLSVCNLRDVICADCFEKRIGRPLRVGDLKPCGVTREYRYIIELYRRENNVQ